MVSLRQAGLRRKYCNPTQGSCIDPIHEAHSDGHPKGKKFPIDWWLGNAIAEIPKSIDKPYSIVMCKFQPVGLISFSNQLAVHSRNSIVNLADIYKYKYKYTALSPFSLVNRDDRPYGLPGGKSVAQ